MLMAVAPLNFPETAHPRTKPWLHSLNRPAVFVTMILDSFCDGVTLPSPGGLVIVRVFMCTFTLSVSSARSAYTEANSRDSPPPRVLRKAARWCNNPLRNRLAGRLAVRSNWCPVLLDLESLERGALCFASENSLN